MYSLLLSRTPDIVREDMDEPGSLTAEFGHGTQELMNLLLSGRAVSQVFDGVKPLGDSGLVLRGIEGQTDIGFLSFHEAMRQVSVLSTITHCCNWNVTGSIAYAGIVRWAHSSRIRGSRFLL